MSFEKNQIIGYLEFGFYRTKKENIKLFITVTIFQIILMAPFIYFTGFYNTKMIIASILFLFSFFSGLLFLIKRNNPEIVNVFHTAIACFLVSYMLLIASFSFAGMTKEVTNIDIMISTAFVICAYASYMFYLNNLLKKGYFSKSNSKKKQTNSVSKYVWVLFFSISGLLLGKILLSFNNPSDAPNALSIITLLLSAIFSIGCNKFYQLFLIYKYQE